MQSLKGRDYIISKATKQLAAAGYKVIVVKEKPIIVKAKTFNLAMKNHASKIDKLDANSEDYPEQYKKLSEEFEEFMLKSHDESRWNIISPTYRSIIEKSYT